MPLTSVRRGHRAIGGVLLVVAAPVVAQDRTGPLAVPPPLPSYSSPPEALPPVAAPSVVAAPTKTPVRFSDIRVVGEALGKAPARAEWQPGADPVSGLLVERPGPSGFDADWVRTQFAVNRLIDTPVPLDRVTAMVQAINRALIANGYINSGVLVAGGEPVDGAVLELTLVHGRLVATGDTPPISVRWGPSGRDGLDSRYVTQRMRAADGIPLDAIAIERDFRLLAEDAAIATVKVDLTPGLRPGEATLALTVDPARRGDIYLSYGNSRSPAIGGTRAAAGGSLRNLLTPGDLISAEVGVTAERPDVSATYETPLIIPRLSLSIRGSLNEASVVDRPLVPLDIRAEDSGVEVGLAYRLLAEPLTPRPGGGWSPARSLTIGTRLGRRETRTWLLGQPFSFSPGSVDGRAAFNVLRLTTDFVERGIAQVSALSLTLTQGLSGTRSAIPGLATPSPGFRSYLAQLSHARRLSGSGLELRLRATGQWADGLLYSSERLAAGGEFSVRGYRETLLLSDTGAIGSIELAQPFSLSSRGRDARGTDWGAFSVSGFVDGAILHNRVGPQLVPRSIGSVGASLAWVPSDAISARVTYAHALSEAVPVGSRDLQDRGFQFRLTVFPLRLF